MDRLTKAINLCVNLPLRHTRPNEYSYDNTGFNTTRVYPAIPKVGDATNPRLLPYHNFAINIPEDTRTSLLDRRTVYAILDDGPCMFTVFEPTRPPPSFMGAWYRLPASTPQNEIREALMNAMRAHLTLPGLLAAQATHNSSKLDAGVPEEDIIPGLARTAELRTITGRRGNVTHNILLVYFPLLCTDHTLCTQSAKIIRDLRLVIPATGTALPWNSDGILMRCSTCLELDHYQQHCPIELTETWRTHHPTNEPEVNVDANIPMLDLQSEPTPSAGGRGQYRGGGRQRGGRGRGGHRGGRGQQYGGGHGGYGGPYNYA